MRFVKTAASHSTPRTRSCTSAWLETSIATARQPASRICAKQLLHVGDSGVVRRPGGFVADIVADGAEQAAAELRGFEQVLDEEGGGRLAVRAGDADAAEVAAGSS